MQIEERALSTIRPYHNNPRINDAAVDAVAASIKEFGFNQPIVVDEQGVIIVGHTRYKAALKLGMETAPVLVAVWLSPEQARAYRLADNQTATLSRFDEARLVQELLELQGMNYDLRQTGFGEEELLRLLNADSSAGLVDPDAVPEPPDEPTTKPGDLIVLGKHRLLCADSGKPEDVDRLLDGAKIHLVNTDPPYGVKVEPRSNNAIAAGLSSFPGEELKRKKLLNKTCRAEGLKHHQSLDLARHPEKARPTGKKLRARDRPLINDFISDEEFDNLLRAWFDNIARVLLPGRAFFLWSGYSNISNYPHALKASGLYFSQAIIWKKCHPVLTRRDFMGDHEWCFYGWREGAAHQCFGPNNVTDVWEVKKVSPQNMVHLTQKPIELAARAIEYSSRPGENVLDLFGGSGSTLIAAEQTGRRAFLMELDPLYCDVIVARYEQFTGKKSKRKAA